MQRVIYTDDVNLEFVARSWVVHQIFKEYIKVND